MTLSHRDAELARWMGRQGVLRPFLTVEALRRERIKPQTALAMLEKESALGRNIFGCDHGVSGAHPPYCGHAVTEARARALFDSPFANGVGPCQLTHKEGYVRPARKMGGEWRPYINMRVGFAGFRRLVERTGSIFEAAHAYNGSTVYASDFVVKRRKWEDRLVAAGFHVSFHVR